MEIEKREEQGLDILVLIEDFLRQAKRTWVLGLLLILLFGGGMAFMKQRSYTPIYEAYVSFTVRVGNPMYASVDSYNEKTAQVMANTFPSILTSGLLQRLDESELEGVLAHEISHIAHGDIMVSQLAVSLVSVILLLTSFLSRFLLYGRRRSGRDRDSGGGIFLLLGLLALVLQPVAMLISNLIQMAISRKREYAADAEGAALCGSPRGLASALAKISSASYTRQEREDLCGAQMQSMYIHYPKKSVQGLFSTHPPVAERIRLLRELEM